MQRHLKEIFLIFQAFPRHFPDFTRTFDFFETSRSIKKFLITCWSFYSTLENSWKREAVYTDRNWWIRDATIEDDPRESTTTICCVGRTFNPCLARVTANSPQNYTTASPAWEGVKTRLTGSGASPPAEERHAATRRDATRCDANVTTSVPRTRLIEWPRG